MCAANTNPGRISCYTKLLIVVKGFRYCLFSKISYPFELLRLSFRKNLSLKKECRPLERPRQSVREKLSYVRTARAIRRKKLSSTVPTSRAIRSKNCHPFERLELSVPKYCHPLYCSKPLSPHPRRPRGSQSLVRWRCKWGARAKASPWVPTLTRPFPNGQANAGSKNFRRVFSRPNWLPLKILKVSLFYIILFCTVSLFFSLFVLPEWWLNIHCKCTLSFEPARILRISRVTSVQVWPSWYAQKVYTIAIKGTILKDISIESIRNDDGNGNENLI